MHCHRLLSLPLQVIGEEWIFDLLYEKVRRSFSEVRPPQPVVFRVPPAAMGPWAIDEICRSLWRLAPEGGIGLDCTITVFCVVASANDHNRGLDIIQTARNVPFLPPVVVIRMPEHLLPERDPFP